LFASSSPIDGYILSTFSGVASLHREDPLYLLMKALGQDMIDLVERKTKRLERLKAEARVLPVRHLKTVFSDISEDPKLAMELYLRFLDDELVVMSITPSNRGDGWEFLRLGDNTIVDFRAIADDPEVRFVHTSGFLAKTRTRLPMEQAVELACRAIAGEM
jgi:hypothetical protein